MDGGNASMTKEIILITGGARSGKSRYAEQRALEMSATPLYVATAEANDEEMAQRIVEHRKRRGTQWRIIEEPLELTRALLAERGETDCALVDCLTLWINNLLIRHDDRYASERSKN
jgi:adenosylcobinamide kinase/adenosylcobinamide-phosphate guanylyltransferase